MADQRFVPGDVEQVWYRYSDVPGPTVVVLGGIHGNEQPGIEFVKRMVSGDFKIPLERGKLIVVLGNLAAIKANSRSVKINLNRAFRDFSEPELEQLEDQAGEIDRAQALMTVLDEADSALDLHAFRAMDGIPFIITEPRGFKAARAIWAPYISSGWDAIEPGATNGYMEKQGKIGLCYELAQLEDLKRGIPRGEQGVLRFLEHMQLVEITRQDPVTEAPIFVHATHSILAKAGFTWGPNHPYRSFQALKSGEKIAQNGPSFDDSIMAGDNQVIIFPSIDKQPQPGDEMFNLGTIIDPPQS